MGDLEKLLALSREQIGTHEQPPGSNNVIYNTEFYGGEVSGEDKPWCCAFIWSMFKRLGLSHLFCGGEKTAYCPYVVNWAQQHGQWITDGYQPGDLLLYDWNGDGIADHIGICESTSVYGATLSVIEGNCGDAVQRVQRWFGSVMGAYRPVYETGEDTSSGAGGVAEDINVPGTPDTYTVQPGDMLGLIALRFGTSIRELARLNGIEDANRIWPGQVLKLKEDAKDEGTSSDAAAAPSPEGKAGEETEITEKARAVIRGEYGNGLVRRFRLGKDYDKVQAEVNRLLMGR